MKLEHNNECILGASFWNELVSDWVKSESTVTIGFLSGINEKDIEKSLDDDLNKRIKEFKSRQKRYEEKSVFMVNWMEEFHNTFSLPKYGKFLFLIINAIDKKFNDAMELISKKFGSKVLFELLMKESQDDFVDIKIFKAILNSKEFKLLEEEKRKDILEKISKVAKNTHSRDYWVLGLKCQIELKKDEKEILEYIKEFKNDGIFISKAEKIIGKEIIFLDEDVKIETFAYTKEIDFSADNVMRLSKLTMGKSKMLVDAFTDVLADYLKENDMDYRLTSISSIKVSTKTIDELKIADDLLTKKVKMLYSALSEINFSEDTLASMTEKLKTFMAYGGLKEDVSVEKSASKKVKI